MASRRRFLQQGALGLGALALGSLPRRLAAQTATSDRRFLFVYCAGGWDTTYAFTPSFGNPLVDMPDDAEAATLNGIPLVVAESRPQTTRFFENWGDRACVLNGLEVGSVAHAACRRHMVTGSLRAGPLDWATLLATQATGDPLLPSTLISGPAFTHGAYQAVVRVGEAGQLPQLLSGDALLESDWPIAPPTAELEALQDAYVQARAKAWAAEQGRGRAEQIAAQATGAVERRERLEALSEELDFPGGTTLLERGLLATQLFEQGLARCAMIQHDGWQGFGWDTHGNNALQGEHFEDLLGGLDQVLAELASRGGPAGGSLLDETTVVVLSEMNRYPSLNSRLGKEHWTHTSAMLLGAGVRGGQAVGELDENFLGRHIDPMTGALDEGGIRPSPADLGATLCRLGGVDPAEAVPEGVVLEALVDG